MKSVFPEGQGWTVEESNAAGFTVLTLRLRGQLALARIVSEGSVTRQIVEEMNALRDMNQAYLVIIYKHRAVSVQPEAQSYATRLGVRIVEI